MAQLKSSIVTGSLQVTDTIYTTDINLSSASASHAVVTDANKKLVSFQIQGLNQTKTLGKKFNNTNIHSTNFDSKPQTLINSIFSL